MFVLPIEFKYQVSSLGKLYYSNIKCLPLDNTLIVHIFLFPKIKFKVWLYIKWPIIFASWFYDWTTSNLICRKTLFQYRHMCMSTNENLLAYLKGWIYTTYMYLRDCFLFILDCEHFVQHHIDNLFLTI